MLIKSLSSVENNVFGAEKSGLVGPNYGKTKFAEIISFIVPKSAVLTNNSVLFKSYILIMLSESLKNNNISSSFKVLT
jgi:hypothetical protein